MLDKAHVLIDSSIISQLAIYEPRTFEVSVFIATSNIFVLESRQFD